MSETGQQRPTSRPRAGGPDARRPGPPSPQGSPQGEPRQSATRFAMLLALARGAFAWENIWPAVWPMLGVPGAFLAVALHGLLPALNGSPPPAVRPSEERKVGNGSGRTVY